MTGVARWARILAENRVAGELSPAFFVFGFLIGRRGTFEHVHEGRFDVVAANCASLLEVAAELLGQRFALICADNLERPQI